MYEVREFGIENVEYGEKKSYNEYESMYKKINFLSIYFGHSRRPIFVLGLFLYSIFYILYSAPTAHALTLSLDATGQKYGPGDTFVVTVRADDIRPDECFNAANVTLLYPKDLVNVVALSKGESLLTLWPEEPAIDREKGSIRFSGGIPAGYCGRVVGDPGRTNILAKVIFSVPGFQVGGRVIDADTPFALTFDPTTAILLNDGRGTPANLVLRDLALVRTVLPGTGTNEWTTEVHADTLPPEVFFPTVESDKETFGGKYFLVFSTTDKQSGLHHFEVSEEDPLHPGYIRGTRYDQVVPLTTASPYVLKDQELRSTIIVTAFDNAGNKQRVQLPPPAGTSTAVFFGSVWDFAWYWWVIGLVVVFLILGGVWWFMTIREEAGEVRM